MKPILTKTCHGHTIEVFQDENPENPREWDNLGTMACFHRRYRLGDENHGFRAENHGGWDEVRAAIEEREGPTVWLPLYLLDHGGITMNTTGFADCDPAGWDWGQVGFIYASHARIRAQNGLPAGFPVHPDEIKDHLRLEVSIYDDYLRGNVHGYVVKGPDGAEADSCWGFIGEPEKSGLLDQARAAAGARSSPLGGS